MTPIDTPVQLHRREFRVPPRNIDAARMMHFAAPLEWEEELLCGWLRDIGQPLQTQFDNGVGAPYRELTIRYHGAIAGDDLIEGVLRCTRIGTRSFSTEASFSPKPVGGAGTGSGAPAVVVVAQHVWCAVTPTPKSQPLPDWLRASLNGERSA